MNAICIEWIYMFSWTIYTFIKLACESQLTEILFKLLIINIIIILLRLNFWLLLLLEL